MPARQARFVDRRLANIVRHDRISVGSGYGATVSIRPPSVNGGMASGLVRPTLLGVFVLGAALDPAFARRRLLAFPERRIGLQPIDQKMAGGEGGFAMRRCGCDEHDAVARLEAAVAMDDQHG